MNYNSIICLDFETTSLDRDRAEIWQIGAVALRPRDLNIYDTQFNLMMRVDHPEESDPQSLSISRMTIDRVMDEGVDPGEGWHAFADWCSQFNLGGKPDLFSAPIMAGHNIANYDRPIYERYSFKHRTLKWDKKMERDVPGIFNPSKFFDTLQLLGYWTENVKEPRSLALVNLRKFMGMSQEGIDNAHDALQDVKDTAAILQRLLRLARTIGPRVKFKGCFQQESQPMPEKQYAGKPGRKKDVG